MSVATELTRLQTAKANIKTSIENKGVTVSSDALLDAYPALIDSIPTGSPEEKTVNFIDFDGTIVTSYDGSEIAGLSALPDAPDHSEDEVPLTAETWNWTLAEINSYHTNNPEAVIWVGMTYHTTDGLNHLIVVTESNNYTVTIYASGTVDWGDGTTESVSGDSSVSHTYSNAGRYNISFEYTDELSLSSNTNPSTASCLREFYGSQSLRYLPMFSGSSVQKIVLSNSNNDFQIGNGKTDNLYNLICIIYPKISYAFSRMIYCAYDYNLKYLSIPNDTALDKLDIAKCKRLRGVTLSESSDAFNISEINSTDIKTLFIPENYKMNSSNIFQGACFDDVYLPSTWVTASNLNTFGSSSNYCTILNGLHFSNSFPNYFACAYVNGLRSLSIPEGVETVRLQDFSMVSLYLPSTLTTIEAIKNCGALKQISIPSGLTTIADNAFTYCRYLQDPVFPAALTSIGAGAFNYVGSSSQCNFTFLSTTPPTLGSSAFTGFSGSRKIYVPYSSDHSVLEAYKTATNWSNYASYIEELPE